MAVMRKLAAHELHLREGNSLILQLLSAGEGYFSIAANVDGVEELKTKGGPVDWGRSRSRHFPAASYRRRAHRPSSECGPTVRGLHSIQRSAGDYYQGIHRDLRPPGCQKSIFAAGHEVALRGFKPR